MRRRPMWIGLRCKRSWWRSLFERTVEEVADAVDRASAGRVIRDSEEPARIALDRFRCQVYEAALQGKVEVAITDKRPSER
jgi:hypothetical protein